jgi:hypothetical protein
MLEKLNREIERLAGSIMIVGHGLNAPQPNARSVGQPEPAALGLLMGSSQVELIGESPAYSRSMAW